MQVPFVDLRAQYVSIKDEVDAAIRGVLDDCAYVGGVSLDHFERDFAVYCRARYAIGVANGTDALHLALRAVGVGADHEVIAPAHTFIATAAAIEMSGARPVFVDVDPETYTMDPTGVEAAITPRTRAIIPVHLYGQPVDMQPILEVADQRDLVVIEDAAQAHGAEYRGQRVGGIGHLGCFSFYPSKNLGAYGDGGAVTTNDAELARRVSQLRDHGRISKYEHSVVGYNSRLDALQAAVLRVKLQHLDEWNRQRQRVAAWYDEALALAGLAPPRVRPDSTHVYHLYVVRTATREEFRSRLESEGISTGVHYPIPLHLQPAFRHLGYRIGDLPASEAAANQVFSLPIFPELTRAQVESIAGIIGELLREGVVLPISDDRTVLQHSDEWWKPT